MFYNPATGFAMSPSVAGRPDPRFVSIQTFYTPDAAGSLYDGLQIGIQHRLSRNLSAAVAYTYSRLKDSTTGPFYYPDNQFNVAGEWANSPDDQRHTLTLASSYLFKWGVSLSGTFHYGSGQAFQVTANQNPFNTTTPTDRTFSAATRYYTSASNITGETINGALYNVVKRDSLYGNPIERLDMRLSKPFTLKERFRFIPMIEAFNLLNHSNFGGYQSVVTLASYGSPVQNADLAYAARMLQFAGRFEF